MTLYDVIYAEVGQHTHNDPVRHCQVSGVSRELAIHQANADLEEEYKDKDVLPYIISCMEHDPAMQGED